MVNYQKNFSSLHKKERKKRPWIKPLHKDYTSTVIDITDTQKGKKKGKGKGKYVYNCRKLRIHCNGSHQNSTEEKTTVRLTKFTKPAYQQHRCC